VYPRLLWVMAIPALAYAIGEPRPWESALALAFLTMTTGAGIRSAALLLAAVLFVAACPPLMLPTYWIWLVPLVWLWRYRPLSRIWPWEALAVGSVMAWLGAPFLRTSLPFHGWAGQAGTCSLFALQMLGVAAGLRIFRPLATPLAAGVGALIATGCEVLQALYGFGWPCMSVSLPAAATPLAQWAYYVGPFGVSFFLYLVNFLWLPDIPLVSSRLSPLGRRGERALSGLRRWAPSAAAGILAVSAWVGGRYIENQVPVRPLPFAALIVQPRPDAHHVGSQGHELAPRWRILDRLTTAALAEDSAVDLVIWPESALGASPWADRLDAAPANIASAARSSPLPSLPYPPASGERRERAPRSSAPSAVSTSGSGHAYSDHGPSVASLAGGPPAIPPSEFYRILMPRYLIPCLAGGRVQTTAGQSYNSACLILPDGAASRQDKLQLVPVLETLPACLDYDWFRTKVLPLVGATPSVRPAENFHLLHFNARDGRPVSLGLSICYEMYFPWLPQFQQKNKAEAIVHLTNETWCRDYPSYWQFETWACQYRAIETRTWQLVCTTMGNSAVIDPCGVVRSSLAGKAGTIRTSRCSRPR
jgi:apolipoprotein N-acyltransferase